MTRSKSQSHRNNSLTHFASLFLHINDVQVEEEAVVHQITPAIDIYFHVTTGKTAVPYAPFVRWRPNPSRYPALSNQFCRDKHASPCQMKHRECNTCYPASQHGAIYLLPDHFRQLKAHLFMVEFSSWILMFWTVLWNMCFGSGLYFKIFRIAVYHDSCIPR